MPYALHVTSGNIQSNMGIRGSLWDMCRSWANCETTWPTCTFEINFTENNTILILGIT